jgi:hypothetical protein
LRVAGETSWTLGGRAAVLLAVANPANVDVLEYLRTLATSLEAGEVTHEEHAEKLAELRSTFVRLS